ncbi:MAG: T9SS type A sorting domain-containing protein, partial [Cryomorphaceae bacterium]
YKKVFFEYDNQGRLLVENEFENKEEAWLKSIRRIFTYDTDGFVEYTVNKQWSSSDEKFENNQRTFFHRNYMDLVTQEIVENYSVDSWTLSLKREYLYNDQNMISQEVSFDWHEQQQEWQPEMRKIYEYNQSKDVVSEIYQIWMDTMAVWVNASLRDYEYNDDRQLVNLRESKWNHTLEKWISESFQALSYTPLGQIENASSYDAFDDDGSSDALESVEASYDENGNLNMTVFKEWDAEQNSWSPYEKHIHFWSQYLIGNLDQTDNEIECLYANPHTVGLPWHCNGLLQNETYNLSVFNHNGVLHHSQQFRGSDTFRLTKSLEKGLYMVVITGGLTIHTEKMIIRN